MVLAMVWSSLPTILKLTRDNSWRVMLWWSWMGDGAFMCSLNLYANVLPDSPMYSLSQSPCHTWTCRSLHSFARWYLYLWGVPRGPWWYCLLWKTFLSHVFCRCFAALTHALNVWDSYVGLIVTACFVCVFDCPLISTYPLLLFDVGSCWSPFWVLASF